MATTVLMAQRVSVAPADAMASTVTWVLPVAMVPTAALAALALRASRATRALMAATDATGSRDMLEPPVPVDALERTDFRDPSVPPVTTDLAASRESVVSRARVEPTEEMVLLDSRVAPARLVTLATRDLVVTRVRLEPTVCGATMERLVSRDIMVALALMAGMDPRALPVRPSRVTSDLRVTADPLVLVVTWVTGVTMVRRANRV